MQASAFEFRIRYLLHTVVYALAFWSPWNYLLHADPTGASAHVWGYLSAVLSESGLMTIGRAFDLLLVLGTLCAVAGAFLRTWGAAYLGSGIVQDGAMHAGVIADGPYRHLRNPHYLGTFIHTLALALLMPRTGAIFAILVIGLMQIRLILGEEAFLGRTLGAPYLAYKALVPRLWPAIRPRVAAGGRTPRWLQAIAGEIYMIGVAIAFVVLGWEYNAHLLFQGVLVSLGLSLIVRAALPGPKKVPQT